MKPLVRPALVGIALLSSFAAVAVAAPQKKVAPTAKGYASIQKIVSAKCVGCHQGPNAAEHIDLSSYAMVMKAKFKGKAIVVAKKPALSVLSKAVHGAGVMRMPPQGKLAPEEIAAIDKWIAAGAKK